MTPRWRSAGSEAWNIGGGDGSSPDNRVPADFDSCKGLTGDKLSPSPTGVTWNPAAGKRRYGRLARRRTLATVPSSGRRHLQTLRRCAVPRLGLFTDQFL